jgi:hypothetical protein
MQAFIPLWGSGTKSGAITIMVRPAFAVSVLSPYIRRRLTEAEVVSRHYYPCNGRCARIRQLGDLAGIFRLV